ncbi:MAG TPA: AmmeMemoRadiSam system protein B [Drouetiella sp.]
MSNFLSRANSNPSQKRPTSFAGSWYEADAKKLRAQVQSYLKDANSELSTNVVEKGFDGNSDPNHPLLAIVAPHAGYMFSGGTAAFSYQQAKAQNPKRIFLLGPSHYVGFEGAVLPAETVFATPLGDLNVDKDVVQDLKDFPLFQTSSQIHQKEHSLEMQLPFIKETFGDVKIVPIIVGQLDQMDVQLMAQILRRYLQKDDLIVVSSDFTHFGPRYGYEPFKSDFRENIKKLDAEAFLHLSKHDLGGFTSYRERTDATICGFYPCSVLIALLPEDAHGSLLRYRTTQDMQIDEAHNSVSYLALAFSAASNEGWKKIDDAAALKISDTDKQNLLKVARLTLETFVKTGKRPSDGDLKFAVSPFVKQPMGAFVTLYKHNSSLQREKELRGCIGYIWPIKSLLETVVDNAIGACSKDYRFHNVTASELNDIDIDINVLTAPRRVAGYNDIVVGRDGVVLYKDGLQSVFLPSVATEFGWDLPEMLTQLAQKAGLKADDWKEGAKFDVFQSESFEEK